MKKIHFISGLPRAGSTLLSAILKQNPRFTSGISDPLQGFIRGLVSETNKSVGMSTIVNTDKIRDLARDLVESYYKDGNEVCFNTSRGWTNDTSLLRDIYPDFKMIICVRDVNWILNSFENLNSKNPYSIKPLYHHQDLSSVYERSNMLLGNIPSFTGFVGGPLNGVKQAMFSNETDHLCFVEYDALVNSPRDVMKIIYEFLGEEWFEHDFENVEDSYDEYDQQTKIEGLHKVRRKVENIPPRQILPDDLWKQSQQLSFWKYELNHMRQQLHWIRVIYDNDTNNGSTI